MLDHLGKKGETAMIAIPRDVRIKYPIRPVANAAEGVLKTAVMADEGADERRRNFHIKAKLLTALTVLIMYVMFWSRYALAIPLPPSQILSLFLPVLLGGLVRPLTPYPLLAMLLTGLVLRNLLPNWVGNPPHQIAKAFFSFALSTVVSRAGLAISLSTFISHVHATLAVGVLPVIVEAGWLSILSHGVFGLPWEWAFILGTGVASVSPGVVVPLLLGLVDGGDARWKSNRTVRILLAATGVDVLIATTAFGVAVAVVEGVLEGRGIGRWWVLRGLLEVGMGVSVGAILGVLAWSLKRWIGRDVILCCLTTAWMMGAKAWRFPGAATCGTICAWAVAGNVWSKGDVERADKRLKTVWYCAEPFLFPVIGASISLASFDTPTLVLSLICVACSICIKLSTAFVAARWGGLDKDEATFLSGVWTGKASVQAALSSTPLTLIQTYHLESEPDFAYAHIVFAGMVSAILIGAPVASGWVAMYRNNEGKQKEMTHSTVIGDEVV
ncbi:hypothetical protein SpCBS45565_g01644 [Spizellomyces sp. 'palustris']|nr:hypothetical protein SpCBS45565_g01644 [Spizellomyces sp. 'palustris']